MALGELRRHVPASGKIPVSDEELVRSVARGEVDALGELFVRHEASVRRSLARLGVPYADVDDVTQTVFLQLLRAAPRFVARTDPPPARAWVLGVTVMMARRHGRSLGRAARNLVRWAEVQLGHMRVARTPLEIAQTLEDVARLERAMQALSAKKREVFVLVTLEGMSGDDVAAALGIPVNTVWTRLHHARQELRGALRGDLP